jgi:hypothetical protein
MEIYDIFIHTYSHKRLQHSEYFSAGNKTERKKYKRGECCEKRVEIKEVVMETIKTH